MLDACKAEYIRRGSPMSAVGWSYNEISKFMQAKLRNMRPGCGDDVGAFAHQLPAKIDGAPPPLPQWVEDAMKDLEDEETEEAASAESDNDDVTDQGWKVIRRRKMFILEHGPTGKRVELGEEKREVVEDEDGIERPEKAQVVFWWLVAQKSHVPSTQISPEDTNGCFWFTCDEHTRAEH